MKKCMMIFLILINTVFAQDSSNPAMEGFNAANSDAKAIEIADKVMEAHGGRANWDNTQHITWNFFGRRTHVWNKWTGDYRMEKDSVLVLMNLNSQTGRVFVNDIEVAGEEEKQTYLKSANSIWINDSYWMFLPFKLKDSGVTLKYVGEGNSEAGEMCDILQLTFENVGDTPENKYHVLIDKKTNRLVEWAFYPKADDAEPRFRTPWGKWQQHGKILLSADRGKYQHSNIAVFEMLPAKVYQSSEKIDVMQFQIGRMD